MALPPGLLPEVTRAAGRPSISTGLGVLGGGFEEAAFTSCPLEAFPPTADLVRAANRRRGTRAHKARWRCRRSSLCACPPRRAPSPALSSQVHVRVFRARGSGTALGGSAAGSRVRVSRETKACGQQPVRRARKICVVTREAPPASGEQRKPQRNVAALPALWPHVPP